MVNSKVWCHEPTKKLEIRTCQQKAITNEQREFTKALIKKYEGKEFADPFTKHFGELAENKAKAKDDFDSKELQNFLDQLDLPPPPK